MTTPFPFHRSVFYPGAGLDVRPVAAFAREHRADHFVHVDLGVTCDEIRARFGEQGLSLMEDSDRAVRICQSDLDDEAFLEAHRSGSRDYVVASCEDLPLATVFPGGVPEVMDDLLPGVGDVVEPYALVVRFRKALSNPMTAPWPDTLSVLFLGTEAVATYRSLFCTGAAQPPLAIAYHQGMHADWGQGGPLHHEAVRAGRFPEYLLLMDPWPSPWAGYEPLGDNLWRRG